MNAMGRASRDNDYAGPADVPTVVDEAQKAALMIVKTEVCVLWNLISGSHIHKVAALMGYRGH